jgi:hypothetical protein
MLTASAFAARQVVRLKSGAEIVGEVTKTETGYRVQTRFGVITYSDEDVASVEDLRSPQEELRQRRAAIDDSDTRARYNLAVWAIDKNLMEEARDELRAICKLAPDFERAALQLRVVEGILRQRAEAETQPTTAPETDEGNGSETRPTTRADANSQLISEKEISRVRLAEMGSADSNLRVSIPREAVDRFVAGREGSAGFDGDAFRRMSPAQQLLAMIDELGHSSPLLAEVEVASDPQFMQEFQRRIWPLIRGRCASSQCHGAETGKGGLKFWSAGVRNARVDYSNFLAADMFVKDGNWLINRDRPAESLLLQYGLPESQATHKHPGNARLRPMFSSTEDASYKAVLGWIKSLKGPRHPDYGIKYRPPFGPKVELGPVLPPRESKSDKDEPQRDDNPPVRPE